VRFMADDLPRIDGYDPDLWFNNKNSWEEADLVTVEEGMATSNINPISFVPSISGGRKESKAWSIRKPYGEIVINATNQTYFPQLQMILYRKINAGEYVPIKAFSASEIQQSRIVFLDKYLERDQRYTYLIKAQTAPDGEIIYSNEIAL